MIDIGGGHTTVALQNRLHAEAAHHQVVAAGKAGARGKPIIVHRAAKAADIRHIGPGIIRGAGDKILALHVGIAERTEEAPPNLLLRCNIKHEVNAIHRKPVKLSLPLGFAPEGHGVGKGAVIIAVARLKRRFAAHNLPHRDRRLRQIHLHAHL